VRLACVIGLAAVLAALATAGGAVRPAAAGVDPALGGTLAAAAPNETVDVLVVLKAQEDVRGIRAATRPARVRAVVKALRARAAASQTGLVSLLRTRRAEGAVTKIVPLWVIDAIEVVGTPAVIEELAARPEVREIRPNLEIAAPAGAESGAPAEPNIDLANADALWNLGIRGQGVVVASMDTGVDASHPDLAGRWRGGTNSWYDPNGEHPTVPTDVSGHGTWTMGVMVGGDAGGTSIGMAPDASWIAVKIFNDHGIATTAGIHLGFQWLLDPDGNPSTADAPNVVNDSWTTSTFTCDLEFQPDLQGLRAAGIVPVFAAGNFGPGTSTVPSPANNPEALSVGAVDNSLALDPGSGRGPSACGGSVAPDLVAPGVGIHTTDVYGLYTTASGTSFAAPHVTGALALLLSAFPNLTADQQEAALAAGAADLGPAGPDNGFGAGELDALASYAWLASSPDFGVSATPATVTAPAGSTASFDVTVAGTGGFAGDVDLALSGPLTSTASWAFSPAAVAGGSGVSRLDVTTATGTAPGSYQLVVSGTSGAITRTTQVTLVVPAPADFGVSATPAATSVVAGGSVSYQVGVSSLNGYAGTVQLGLSGLSPLNGSSSFSPPSIATAGSSKLTIVTFRSASAGTYALTISGTDGSTMHSVPVTLTILPGADFSLSLSPASRTVARGKSTSYSVTISAQGGFHGKVSLSVSGLPSGAKATFSRNPVAAPGTSTLTVKTGAKTPRGTFTITVKGASGLLSHSASATLIVQ
jgi:subtilisin family serine protease